MHLSFEKNNRATSLNTRYNPWILWPRAGLDIVAALYRWGFWSDISNQMIAPVPIGNDFFGINIATSDDPACDDNVIDYLTQLGLTHVRMNMSYCSLDGNTQRLLDKVLAAGFDVMLDIIPPREEAAKLHTDRDAQECWRQFTEQIFQLYNGKVSCFEIGSTPNRGKWSGFNSLGYLTAWEIACLEAEKQTLHLAGPNVSDFEPLYNTGFLRAMKRAHSSPTIHTDNLFVERVIEPEAYDHRVLGRWATQLLKLNLIKKARILDQIGRQLGCEFTYCTFKCWTTRRLGRNAGDPEQKHADYLVRYLVLAASSGALNRVYWGALICSRDGIVNCGSSHYPEIENVTFYRQVRGKTEDFRSTPAFFALKTLINKLNDVICVQGISADNGINHFVFSCNQGGELHINWCRDGKAVPLDQIYPSKALEHAQFTSMDGKLLAPAPAVISEQPFYIYWDMQQNPFRPNLKDIAEMPKIYHDSRVYPCIPGQQVVPISTPDWQGIITANSSQSKADALANLLPANLEAAKVEKLLRDTKRRNRVWSILDPDNKASRLTVKLIRIKGLKRLSYRFKPSKAQRQWNNGAQMLRRGINTPQPIAYFDTPINSGINDSYYICRYLEDTFSVKEVFASFRQGQDHFLGISKQTLMDKIAGFVQLLHSRKFIHRDLSAGNILIQHHNHDLILYVIDIGRTRTLENKLTPRQRMIDLMRICYKLSWPDRELFIENYNRHLGHNVASWWRLPVSYYETKQTLKKGLKKKLGLK